MERVTLYTICPVTLDDVTNMFIDLNLGDIHAIHVQPRSLDTLYIAEYKIIFDINRVTQLHEDCIQRKNDKGYIQLFKVK